MRQIPIRDIVNGFEDSDDNGVRAMGGNLNIRPPYQREFIYNDKQQQAVINTVMNAFPLNVLYFSKNENGTLEVIDGQQRILSICNFYVGGLTVDYQNYHTWDNQKDKQEKFLSYPLQVYICEGTDSEKLEWFKVINTVGEKLNAQELRNAVYTGKWLTEAKKYFSKNGCAAFNIGKNYVSGTPIRQDYLETTIEWISKGNIEQYMAEHQKDTNANELRIYFEGVISWVRTIFPDYRKEMKGIEWGTLYNNCNGDVSTVYKEEVDKLMLDDEVTNKKGIYQYLLTKDEKHLNIRTFSDNIKRTRYEEQNGVCPICGVRFDISEMEADHIIAWKDGGKTDKDNCQMLCRKCNRTKSGK